MRIIHITSDFRDASGGLQRAVVEIVNLQSASGHDTSLIFTGNNAESVNGMAALHPAVEVLTLGEDPVSPGFGWHRDLRGLLRRTVQRGDVVLIHSAWHFGAVQARMLARRGARVVLLPHGSLDPFDLRKHATAKRFLGPVVLRHQLAAVDAVLTTNQREADLLETYGAKPTVLSLPLPVTTDVKPDPTQHRKSTDTDALLFLGRVNYKKGLHRLLDLYVRLRDGGLTLSLTVAGSGEAAFAERLERNLADLKFDGVSSLGWVDRQHAVELLRTCKAFVLLSDNENFGLSVVEAFAAGALCILSDGVYIAHEAAEAGAALVIPLQAWESDPAWCAEQVRSLLADQERSRDMRKSAQELYKVKYSPHAVASQYETFLDNLPVR